ncbi:MAG: IS1634 family transposase [Polyangiaceae bacterium]|nr:IS1634 family transposase [Polyangiaceae bacterium]
MASLQKHRVGGRTYWRIVESRRINGKPRAVPILYLGTADDLLDRLLEGPGGDLRIHSYQHGDVAALKAVADRLGVVSIIDRHVTRKARGLSVGTTLLLAALNRAIRPRSKRAWASWASQTSIERLFPKLRVNNLGSQFFWDQMDCVPVEALQRIEDDLTKVVVEQLGIRLDTLFYDATNFFTYIASTNTRPKMPQRGRSKQKRGDLRLFSLALLVSRESQIPLCSHVYEGNRVDAKSFPDSLSRIRERLEKLSLDVEDLTIVYDKGNLSKDNQHWVDESPFGYVASLVPTHHQDLMAIPVDDYHPLGGDCLGDIPVLRLTRPIWGKERTVLLFISDQLQSGQIRGLLQHLKKRIQELEQWKTELVKPRSGPRSVASAKKRIESMLTAQHLKKVLKIEYDPARTGSERLRYWIDEEARRDLEKEVFGKRILITDRSDWSDEEILLAYRGQSEVEEAFRQLKDDEHMAVRPQYHWTDQKIHVHTFCCLLALLLGRVIEREARGLGYCEGLSGLLDLLGTVRLAMVLRSSGKRGGRPRCEWKLEESTPEALQLFKHLVPNEPPFVYT